jgi:hypothetical protein
VRLPLPLCTLNTNTYTASYQHSISDMIEDPSASVADAAIANEILALSVYSHSVFRIKVFALDGTRFILRQVFEVEGEVTALSVNIVSGGISVLAGLWQNNQSVLSIFPINPSQSGVQASHNLPRSKKLAPSSSRPFC